MERAVGACEHVEVNVEIAHALPVVEEVGQRHCAFSVDVFAVEGNIHLRRQIPFHRGGEGV